MSIYQLMFWTVNCFWHSGDRLERWGTGGESLSCGWLWFLNRSSEKQWQVGGRIHWQERGVLPIQEKNLSWKCLGSLCVNQERELLEGLAVW